MLQLQKTHMSLKTSQAAPSAWRIGSLCLQSRVIVPFYINTTDVE